MRELEGQTREILSNAMELSMLSNASLPYETVMGMTMFEKQIASDLISNRLKQESKNPLLKLLGK